VKLLVVEDNPALNDMIAGHLRKRGFDVDAVRDGASALAAIDQGAFDAVILDLGLPDMDGMDVLRAMRRTSMAPALILTARDAVAHRVAGLDAGADDYVLKPFELTEFEARLRAVLRRPGWRATPASSFGDLSYDSGRHAACRGDTSVELTRREAALFEELIRNGETIVVRDVLAEKMYGDGEDVSANALEATVSRLRRKIAGLGSAVSIDSMRGIGYRLRRAP
jgi:DNA-binding response OmpR family regulator